MATPETQTSATLLHVSVSPHVRAPENVSSIMLSVIIALVPAFIASIFFFGFKALLLTAVCVTSCILTEWAIVKYLFKKQSTLTDYSAVITGVLLAFNLPPDLPFWMAILGSAFAIGVVKMAFGGLGNNFVNPALAGRAFLLASYPVAMTSWSATRLGSINGLSHHIDAISSATPLAAYKAAMAAGTLKPLDFQDSLWDLFIGNVGGCIGETSALALVVGAVFLIYKRVIGLTIPVAYIATVFLLFWIFNGVTRDLLTSDALFVPTFQVLAGGLMLGAFFMATDMVTSPLTFKGHLIFAICCGVLTFSIRKYGGYPEGVSYSILIMNLFVPLINKYTKPRIYGKVDRK